VVERDGRAPVDRFTNRRPPRERDFVLVERRAAENLGERVGHETLDGNHGVEMVAHVKLMAVERIVLASASPRRAQLLREAGIAFDAVPADVDESVNPGEGPETYVRRVAEMKARAVAVLVNGRSVLAADTTVIIDGVILGKPTDRLDARRMLHLLSGRAHDVITAVALATTDGMTSAVECTRVTFRALSSDEIDRYVDSGEPDDKAGAYGIQGQASGFVSGISGTVSNVVGLPMDLVRTMLRRANPQGSIP
jgi:septum formation protein